MSDETTAQDAEQPVLDLLSEMTAASLERSTLDPLTLMHVRIAALVAVDAPPLSYLMNLGIASELGVTSRAGGRRPAGHRPDRRHDADRRRRRQDRAGAGHGHRRGRGGGRGGGRGLAARREVRRAGIRPAAHR